MNFEATSRHAIAAKRRGLPCTGILVQKPSMYANATCKSSCFRSCRSATRSAIKIYKMLLDVCVLHKESAHVSIIGNCTVGKAMVARTYATRSNNSSAARQTVYFVRTSSVIFETMALLKPCQVIYGEVHISNPLLFFSGIHRKTCRCICLAAVNT